MEDAKLDGNIRKQAIYQGNRAFSSIDRHAGKCPALFLQVMQSGFHNGNRLAFDLLPVDVATFGAINHQAATTSEKRGVQCQRHWRGGYLSQGDVGLVAVELAAQSADAQACAGAQISKRVAACAVGFVGSIHFLATAAAGLQPDVLAIAASVSLLTS